MIIITEICLTPPKYKVVNLAGKILCYAQKPTYKSVRKQLSTVVNFRDRNTVDFAIRIIDNKNNEISVVFKELKGFNSIPDDKLFSHTLHLEPQKFSTIPPSIGYLKQLTYLGIYDLGLVELPNEIGDLVNLIYLDIQDNELTDLPISLKKLKKLEHLNMSYNEFPNIPRVVAKIISLEKLTIQRNPRYRTLRFTDSINALRQKIPHLLIYGE
jgi:Leucine-rich repeat (LRR) protein